ncbi:MAG TPA: tetratricopeptide repeat protein [Streptosporangiaceae bacterium]|jgi:tetratricopeptide (TPR) repeat protein
MHDERSPDASGGVHNELVGASVGGPVVQGRDITVNMPAPWRTNITPRQVRPPTPHFVDRTALIDRLDALLSPAVHERRRVVLTGPPGIGRDALVRRWVDRVRHRFPGGDLYLDCADLTAESRPAAPHTAPYGRVDVGAALEQGLVELGVNPAFLTGGTGTLQSYYSSGTADAPMIVVIRHATNPAQVEALMPTAGGSVVLVTAAGDLSGLDAEFLEVGPLDAASGMDLLTRVCGAERVRAGQAAADELVRRSGGHPLALRTWIAPALPPHNRPLGELAAERTAPDRTDMDAELHVAYRRLPSSTARAFPLLAALPVHDLTAHAVAAALDTDDAAASVLLGDLVAAYLMIEEPRGRFRPHPAYRDPARGQAVADEVGAATLRLVGYELRRAAAADLWLNPDRTRATDVARLLAGHQDPFGDATRADVLAVLDAEADNLPAVVRAAARMGLHTQTWQLAEALTGFYLHHRYVSRWLETSELGIAAAREAQHARAEMRLRTLISRPYTDVGDLDAAGRHLDAAADLVPTVGDLLCEGSLWEFRARYLEERAMREASAPTADALASDAEAAFRRAEDLHERADGRHGPRGVALAIYYRGAFLDRRGRTEEALPLLADARDRFLALPDPDTRMAARALTGLGTAQAHAGAPSAPASLEAAAAQLAGTHYAAEAWQALADLAHRQGDAAAERAHLRRAVEILASFGHPGSGALQARLDELG